MIDNQLPGFGPFNAPPPASPRNPNLGTDARAGFQVHAPSQKFHTSRQRQPPPVCQPTVLTGRFGSGRTVYHCPATGANVLLAPDVAHDGQRLPYLEEGYTKDILIHQGRTAVAESGAEYKSLDRSTGTRTHTADHPAPDRRAGSLKRAVDWLMAFCVAMTVGISVSVTGPLADTADTLLPPSCPSRTT